MATMWSETILVDEFERERDAAYDFLKACGIPDPTPDMIGQLSGPFLAALRIMYERGYDPEGRTWRRKGWRGLVLDILNKDGRIRFHSWDHRRFHGDSAIDLINFAGMYWRWGQEDPDFRRPAWGELGEPGG